MLFGMMRTMAAGPKGESPEAKRFFGQLEEHGREHRPGRDEGAEQRERV